MSTDTKKPSMAKEEWAAKEAELIQFWNDCTGEITKPRPYPVREPSKPDWEAQCAYLRDKLDTVSDEVLAGQERERVLQLDKLALETECKQLRALSADNMRLYKGLGEVSAKVDALMKGAS